MGESRQHTDNASASSEETIKPPPRFDPSRVSIGLGALSPDEFDPLKHNEWENFWHQVDFHFQPINTEHVRTVRGLLAANFPPGHDPDLRLPHPSDVDPIQTPHDSRDRKRDPKRESRRERTNAVNSTSSIPSHAGALPTAAASATGAGGGLTGGGSLEEVPGKRLPDRPPSIKIKMEAGLSNIRTTSSATSDIPSGHPPASASTSNTPIFTPIDPDSPTMRASLNSFPYTHRLVCALVDENPVGTAAPTMPSNRASRPPSDMEISTWIGGNNEADVRAYQVALEERVKLELRDVGLLDDAQEDEVQIALRHDQWKLRDLKTSNRVRKDLLYSTIITSELRNQAVRREEKRHDDKVEMAYLERMISKMKKNKKSRSKYQKLLQRMYGHYKDREKVNEKAKKASEITSNGRMAVSGDEKVRTSGKKKKKSGKKSNHELPAKSIPAPVGPSRKSAT